MSRPWLTVLMPTYNGEAYVAHALESIVIQGDDGVEVIAIDDGSTDATVSILRSYQSRMNLRVLEPGRVGNWVTNTNRCLPLAQGAHLSILHQDDLWMKHRLLRMKRCLEENPGTTLLFHSSWYIDSQGRRLAVIRPPLPAGVDLPPELVVERLLVQDFIMVPAAVFRRDAALAVGGLDEGLWYSGDWDFWLKLVAQGSSRSLSRPLAAFRIHALSQTNLSTARTAEYRRQQETVLERHFGRWSARLRHRGEIHMAAAFSIEMNVALSELAHGTGMAAGSVLLKFLRLGPWVAFRYLRDSRLRERVAARLHLLRAMHWRV